ncbi:MAG: hypothetical protein B7C24_12070 [Bacteroidetes bacterium 4572_77]|nr:MAG: hypothetical protein B7C24_12070 [Bacteroidetes bacterium 4572_77]
MDLSKILSIAGKPGLFQMVSQSKNGLVVESLVDGRRIPAFSHERISSLEEISIFTETDDMPLKEVFQAIFKKEDGKKTIGHKSSTKELKTLLKSVLPDYDEERVYVSDIKKLVNWYNLLVEKELIDLEENKEEETSETAPEDTSEKE